jgi:phosphoglucosamine mutase
MSKYFGTDGFRGDANVKLNVEHAYKIGRFLGYYYGKEHRPSVVIGKDTRRSGYMFECALTAGLTASGADVYLMHVTTTPSVSYITRMDDFDCGIMISASHNPYHDNGIKLLNTNGEKMEQYVIDEVEKYLDGYGPEIPFATGDAIGRAIDWSAGRNRYIGYLISLATHSYKGVRIGLDCANGSTWMMAKNIFETLGAEVSVTGNTPNGLNINDGVGSTHIENLRRLVLGSKLDIGFAFDGDADR